MAPALVGVVQGTISAATYAATEKIAYGRDPSLKETLKVGITSGVMAGGMQFVGQKLGVIQCFIAGTLVATKNGFVPIEDIQQGDLVWATNEETGETALKEVVQLFRNETEEWVHVTVNGKEITCTPNHPFYSPVKGWTSAIDLRAGDILVMLNGEYVVVEQVQHELLESPETTYNFEVENYHTYYVGDEAVLVHNKCQNHYAISSKINRAKSSDPKLNCISRNDPRFQVKALTSDAHRGYQQRHRQYDGVMVNWLKKHTNASAGAFINKLNSVYSYANMVRRFGKVNFRL